MARSSISSVLPREHGDGDEGPDEQDIEKDPDPAEHAAAGIGAALDESEKHGDQGVEGSGREDAFDGAKGAVDAAASLDAVDEAMDFGQAAGEDA